jgi:arginase
MLSTAPAPEALRRRTPAHVEIIGVPMDLGADRRGVDMGPSAIRYAGLRERLLAIGIETVVDHGNIPVPIADSAAAQATKNAKYLPIILAVCDQLSHLVESTVRNGGFPLVLGGDHSIAVGTLAGVARGRKRRPGLIWVDAHGDINTPLTSGSGNVHGMPVSIALEEQSIDPARTVLVGLRDVDPGEKQRIRDLGVRAFSMSHIDKLGMERVMEEAIALASAEGGELHVSFDMDGIDPSEAPGVGTPVRGGLSYREAHLAMEMVAETGLLGSLEITELNPIFDERNRTAELAVELILSALGKSIL